MVHFDKPTMTGLQCVYRAQLKVCTMLLDKKSLKIPKV